MPLRSNFEPGTSRWATRRAQWRALGLTDEDMVKPKVAIVNSSSQLAIWWWQYSATPTTGWCCGWPRTGGGCKKAS
jgi:dihydroxyacid dehydratase/phosphogluconate dehydratase